MSRSRVAAALLLLLCLCAFLGVGENDFINLDDRLYITGNPMVARGVTAQGFTWAFTTTRGGNWHPATWLSHMLDVQLFGMEPGRHHLMSLALHSCSAVLLFGALNIMTGATWLSFFAAALFAVHPMRVESVAWASERKDVLALLFTLLAILTYVRGLRRPGTQARLATACCFALALLSKPLPVTFPFLLLLLDWWPLGRWSPRRAAAAGAWTAGLGILPPLPLWREKIPLFLLAAATSTVTFAAQSRAGGTVPGGSVPAAVRAVNAVVSYQKYLADTLWPRDLAVFYPHPLAIPPWPSWTASLLVLAAITVIAWRLRDRHPCLPVGWFWFLGTLLPMIGLVQVGGQARADRYSYLPHIGLLIIAVWWVGGSLRTPRLRRAAVACGAVVVLASAAATAALIPHWRTSVALFTRALALAERHPPGGEPRLGSGLAFIRNCLGQAYSDEGRMADAIREYRQALALHPLSTVTMNNLAKALEKTGEETEANALYVQALRDPSLSEPRVKLGGMLMARGRLDDAIHLFQEAIAIDPIAALGYANLGAALAMKGRPAEAESALRTAVVLAPDLEPARFNLGKLLLEQRRYEEAIEQLRESIRLEPDQAAAPFLLREASVGGRNEQAGRP